MRAIVTALLTLTAAACFLAAATSAVELRERSSATARHHRWQAPAPHAPLPEQVTDIEPVEPIALEAEPEPEPEPIVRAPRKLRRVAAAEPVEAPPTYRVEPEDAIRMALRSKRASFEHCYEQELKKQASFSGFIVVALSLSAAGRVTDARVQEGNARDAVVGACIVAHLRTIRLPALSSEVDLLIPIRLRAKEPS